MKNFEMFTTNDPKFGANNEKNLKNTAEWQRIKTEKNEVKKDV